MVDFSTTKLCSGMGVDIVMESIALTTRYWSNHEWRRAGRLARVSRRQFNLTYNALLVDVDWALSPVLLWEICR